MRTYTIIPTSDIPSVNFDQVLQTSADTLRRSIDGTKALLKYEGSQPTFLSGKPEYTHAQILEILSGDEWTSADPIN